MRISVGGIVGIIGGLIPILYIGFLLRHFIGVGGGSAEGIATIGLGPTVVGLSIVGLLFALPLIVRLLRAVSGTNRVPGQRATTAGDLSADTQGFDADAAFANYMRGRHTAPRPAEADAAGASPVVSPRPGGGFGRKSV